MPENFRNIITGDTSHRRITSSNVSGLLRLPTMTTWSKQVPQSVANAIPDIVSDNGFGLSNITVDAAATYDNDGDYHAYIIELEDALQYSSYTGRIYFRLKVQGTGGNQRRRSDFAIAGITLPYDDSGTFDASAGNYITTLGDAATEIDLQGFGTGWQTTTTGANATRISAARDLSYTDVTTAETSTRWNRDTGGTPDSQVTGPTDGCLVAVDTSTDLSVGNNENILPQVNGNHYMYSECSGIANTGTYVNMWLRSPIINIDPDISYPNLSIMVVYYAFSYQSVMNGNSVSIFWDGI